MCRPCVWPILSGVLIQIKICMGLIEKPMGRERDTHTQGCGDIFKMSLLLFLLIFIIYIQKNKMYYLFNKGHVMMGKSSWWWFKNITILIEFVDISMIEYVRIYIIVKAKNNRNYATMHKNSCLFQNKGFFFQCNLQSFVNVSLCVCV